MATEVIWVNLNDGVKLTDPENCCRFAVFYVQSCHRYTIVLKKATVFFI